MSKWNSSYLIKILGGLVMIGIGCWMPTVAYAQPSLSASSASGAPGTSVTVSVNFTPGATAVSTIQLDLLIPSSLTYVSTATGSAATAAGKGAQGNLISGAVRILVFGLNQTAIGGGSVADIQFNIAGNSAAGTFPTSISNIIASDANGNPVSISGTGGSITIKGTAPAAPTNLSPINGATRVSQATSLSWSASSGATSYDVYFGTASTPPLVTNTTGTSYAAGSLSASTTYYWRVVANNSSGSNSSATISFTTVHRKNKTAFVFQGPLLLHPRRSVMSTLTFFLSVSEPMGGAYNFLSSYFLDL